MHQSYDHEAEFLVCGPQDFLTCKTLPEILRERLAKSRKKLLGLKNFLESFKDSCQDPSKLLAAISPRFLRRFFQDSCLDSYLGSCQES